MMHYQYSGVVLHSVMVQFAQLNTVVHHCHFFCKNVIRLSKKLLHKNMTMIEKRIAYLKLYLRFDSINKLCNQFFSHIGQLNYIV